MVAQSLPNMSWVCNREYIWWFTHTVQCAIFALHHVQTVESNTLQRFQLRKYDMSRLSHQKEGKHTAKKWTRLAAVGREATVQSKANRKTNCWSALPSL